MKGSPYDLLPLWLATLCQGNPKAMLSLYDPKALLVATYGQTIKKGHRQLLGYFRTFMAKKDLCGKIDSQHFQRVGKNLLLNSGLYTFSWLDDQGQLQSVTARFSFVYKRNLWGKWKIMNHHSSVLP